MSTLPVQSASASSSPIVLIGATQTISISRSFGISNVAGNTIVVTVAARVGASGGTASSPSVSDTLGNVYATAQWLDGGIQNPAVGIFYATNIAPGSNTVTFSVSAVNPNPDFDEPYPLNIAITELPLEPGAILQSSGIQQQSIGIGTLAITLNDSTATAVTSNAGNFSQSSFAVADFFDGTGDFFISAFIAGSGGGSPVVPVVSPDGYFHYSAIQQAGDFTTSGSGVGSAPGDDPKAWLVINEPSLGWTDRSAYLHVGDGGQHSFTLQLRQRGQATIELYIPAGDSYGPVQFTRMRLYDQTEDGTWFRVYSGLIQDVEVAWKGNGGDRFVTLTCVSLESVFDTVYAPPRTYVDATCGEILADLFNTFETGCPVTLGTIQDGAVIRRLITNFEKLSDLFDQLATTSEFVWVVDPATELLFFGQPSVSPAPFTFTEADLLWETTNFKTNGQDYRNRQAIRLNYDAFSHSMEFIVGTGQSVITLMRPVQQVTNAYATLSTPNTATGAFSGIPSPGDTVTIGIASLSRISNHIYGIGGAIVDSNGNVQIITQAGTSGGTTPTFGTIKGDPTIDGTVIWTNQGPAGLSTGIDTYVFVPRLDNTQWGQVLIGPSPQVTCRNLADAINANALTRGANFSLPTWECSQCNAIQIISGGFTGTAWGTGAGDGGGLNAFSIRTGGDLATIALYVGFPVLGLISLLSSLFGSSAHGAPAGSNAINLGHLLPFSTVATGDQFILNGNVYTVTRDFTTDHLGNTPVTFTPPLVSGVRDGTLVYAGQSSSFILQQKAAGTGWVSAISTTSSAFAWSGSVTSGGTSPQGSLGPHEGATITLQVYEEGTSTAGPAVVYNPGSNIIKMATPLNAGSNLNVEYTRADGNIIQVEDSDAVDAIAALTHGTGKYQQLTDASSQGLISTSAEAGLQLAQQALAAYSVAPQTLTIETYRPGLIPGVSLTTLIAQPVGAGSILDGVWVIEEINGQLAPVKDWVAGYGGHYRYTVRVQNIQEIGSYLDFWEGLAGSGGGSGSGGLVATSGGALRADQVSWIDVDVDGVHIGQESTVDFIGGANIAITGTDNSDNAKVDVTIAVIPAALGTGGIGTVGSWYQQEPVGVRNGVNVDFFLDYVPASVPTSAPPRLPFDLVLNGIGQSAYHPDFYIAPGTNHIQMMRPVKATDWGFECRYMAGFRASGVPPSVTGNTPPGTPPGTTPDAPDGLPPIITGLQWWFDARFITGITEGGTITTWNDLSGNGHDATVSAGTATYNADQHNGGAALTLDSCALAISGSVASTGIYTIFAVVRTSDPTAGQFILGASSTFGISYLVGFVSGGTARMQAAFSAGGTGFEAYGTAASDTDWHQIDLTQNASVSLKLRIDGADDPLLEIGGWAAGNPAPDLIGASSIGQYFEGQIQLLGYYNRALTLSEIQQIEAYISTPVPTLTGIVFTPSGGTLIGPLNTVSIAGPAGSTIYFTTDGSAPAITSRVYISPILIPVSTTIKAISVDAAGVVSDVAVAVFTVTDAVTVSGTAGSAKIFWKTSTSSNPFTNNPSPSDVTFMAQHIYRTMFYQGYGDSRLTWAPNSVVYRDISGLYHPGSDALINLNPSWILRDAFSRPCYINFPPQYSDGTYAQFAADFGNAGFRAWWIAQATAALDIGYRGIFIDDVNMDINLVVAGGQQVRPMDTRTGSPMTDANYQTYLVTLLELIRSTFPAAELVHNAIYSNAGGNPAANPLLTRQIQAADYYNFERWVVDPGITAGFGKYGLETIFGFIDQIHGLHRNFIAEQSPGVGATDYYPLACFFLVSDGNDLYQITEGNDPRTWAAINFVDLGTASGARYDWNGLLRRDFTGGVVLVAQPGTSGGGALGRALTDPAGNSVTSVFLSSTQGMILLS